MLDFLTASAIKAASEGTVPLPFLFMGMGIALLLILLLYPIIVRPVIRALKQEKTGNKRRNRKD